MNDRQDAEGAMTARHVAAVPCRLGLPDASRATRCLDEPHLFGSRSLPAIRPVIGALLMSVAFCTTAVAQERAFPRAALEEGAPLPRSPLALDIDRQLDAARDIEHELNLEQSRVNARSTSAIQRRQTARDVQLSGQNLNTLKTAAPQQRSIPLLERKLDRVSRPTGAISRDPGLESGFSTSLGLRGSIGRRR
jgi:hypothetical protein